MYSFINKLKTHKLIKHPTKRKVALRYLAIMLVFVLYFVYVANKFGAGQGFAVALLTWSFFVLCTPIADAGFLLDFPIRIISGLKMLWSETIVWLVAISLNIYAYFFNPKLYEKTGILDFFYHILQKPWPYWSIILVSGVGTFLSIAIADELVDKTTHSQLKLHKKHHKKLRYVLMAFVFLIAIGLYDYLLNQLGVSLPKL